MIYQNIPVSLAEILSAAVLVLGFGLIVLIKGATWRSLLAPLLVALCVRILAALYHRFLGMLPEGSADAVAFERRAWEWAGSGCGNLGEHLNLGGSYVHSWVIGNVYACTTRMPLFFQAVNVALGVLTVYLVARLAEEFWDREAAVRAAWVSAFFPLFVIYSAVPLREVWFTAFFLSGALWLVKWAKLNRLAYLMFFLGAMLCAAVIHGSAIFSIFLVAIVVSVWFFKEFFRGGRTRGVVSRSVFFGFFMIFLSGAAGFVFLGDVRFSSIGEVGSVVERAETLDELAESRASGASAYPSYLTPSNSIHAAVLTPVRMAYLLFGPPPWEVRGGFQLFGMLDGIFYLSLVILVYRYRSVFWSRREFRIVLAVFVMIVVVFSWGTSNFGTAVRHRAKFLGLLIALSAGLLGKKRWRYDRIFFLKSRHGHQ